MNTDLQKTIDQRKNLHKATLFNPCLVQSLEANANVETQKDILESLKNIRLSLAESLAKADNSISQGNSNAGTAEIYAQLIEFRKNLAEDVDKHAILENQLMRRGERIEHLRKNFKNILEVRI